MRALPLVCLIGCAVVALASCALLSRYPSQGISKGEGLSRAAGHERPAHGVAHVGEIHKAADTKRQPKVKAPQLGLAMAPASQNLPAKAQIVRCAQRVYSEALSCPGPDQPGIGAIRNNTTGVVTNIDGRSSGFGTAPTTTQPTETFFDAGLQPEPIGNTTPAANLLASAPPTRAPIGGAEFVPVSLSVVSIEPQVAAVNATRPAASLHGSYLDRAIKGAVKGVMLVVLAVVYLVMRALVRKFRARDKGAAAVATAGATPSVQQTTEQTTWAGRALSIFYTRTFWQTYLACFVMLMIAMVAGGGADSGPISFGRFGEIDWEAGRLTLLDVIFGSAFFAAVLCWLFPD